MRKEKYQNIIGAYIQIQFINSKGSFVDANKFLVEDKEIIFDKAICCVGSSLAIPLIKNLDKIKYFTSDNIFDIDHLPEHLIIIGGGAISLELAQAFRRFSSKVTILEALPQIASNFDRDLTEILQKHLQNEGIEIFTSTKVMEIFEDNGKVCVKINHKQKEKVIIGSDLLIATGRNPNTNDLNLEIANVKCDSKGFIKVNEFLRTSNNNIYAAGDCVGKMMLVTVAAMEGATAAENALIGNKRTINYNYIPYALFTDPAIAAVGINLNSLNQDNFSIKILTFDKVPRALLSNADGIIKVVSNKEGDKILGIHILAPNASEIIHKAVLMIKYNIFKDVVYLADIYPALSEGIKLVIQTFEKDISKLSCCAE